MDTQTDLGYIIGKRKVVIESKLYSELSKKYSEAVKSGDTKAADKVRAELLSKWFRKKIKPGQAITTSSKDLTNVGKFPGSDNFSGTFTWFPEDEYLTVKVDVTDKYFDTSSPEDEPYQKTSFEIFISPSGFNEDINQLIAVPDGPNGKLRLKGFCGLYRGVDVSQFPSSWKRTADGYEAQVSIPWKYLKGYREDWKVLPVDAMVNCETPEGRTQLVMQRLGEPWEETRSYAILIRK